MDSHHHNLYDVNPQQVDQALITPMISTLEAMKKGIQYEYTPEDSNRIFRFVS